MNSPGITTMICNLIRLIVFATISLISVSQTNAAIIFDLGITTTPPTSIVGNQLTLTLKDLSVGTVFFDAILTVVGNKDFVANSSTGMGTGTTAGENNVSGTDALTFSMSVISKSGGIAAFSGFTRVALHNLTVGENATINEDGGVGNTIGGQGLTTLRDIAYASTFVISGQRVGDSFQVRRVEAEFTGTVTAVPEPSIFGSGMLAAFAVEAIRRFRRRTNSVDSQSLVA
jgi:hypothetical protein